MLRILSKRLQFFPKFFSRDTEANSQFWELGNEQVVEKPIMQSDMHNFHERKFRDKIRLYFYGGKGGLGTVSYLDTRKKYRGKPGGGNGGKGGDVYLLANKKEPDLAYIRSKVILQ